MENKTNFRPTPQLAFGFIVILLGVLFTLDNLNLLNAGAVLKYWPVLIVGLGVYRLMDPGDPPHYVPGVLFTAIGLIFLANNLHFRLPVRQYWPLMLVLIGLAIISHAFRSTSAEPADASSAISAFAFLSGLQRSCRSQAFRAGDFTAIMGGCEIDLREADIQDDRAVINVFSFWGGIEIRLPEHWAVSAEVLPIMGGLDDHTASRGNGAHKQLIVRGLVIMGGVEVRN